MALLFCDGFDRYGGANSNLASVTAMMAGEWTTITNANIAAPLSATGQALIAATNMTVSKTLTTNYGRIIGGIRFSATLAVVVGVQFNDAGTNQCAISIATTGVITLRNGSYAAGTILGSSSAIGANTIHYLEWDITLGNSAAYNVYLDGVSVISGTGDTTATANNTINGIALITGGAVAGPLTVDDLYLFDSTGSTNNAPLLNSPRIETTLPNSDSSVQFTIGAAVLGGTVGRGGTGFTMTTNGWYVRPYTPVRSCTLNSLTMLANATNALVNLRPLVYSDSSGVPGTLLTTGSTITGITSGAQIVMPLTTPQSLTAGTQYWLGYMDDTGVATALLFDVGASARTVTTTFTSGAPSTAPGGQTTGVNNVILYGNVTSTGANYYEVNQQPPPAPLSSYLTDSTVGHQDMYGFPGLVSAPTTVHAVTLNAYCSRQDTGARTVSMRVNSGGTDSGGTLTGQTPAGSFAWLATIFETDPHTSAAWLPHNLDIATSGFKIDS